MDDVEELFGLFGLGGLGEVRMGMRKQTNSITAQERSGRAAVHGTCIYVTSLKSLTSMCAQCSFDYKELRIKIKF